jgi:uncharacterized membrane protein YqiK
MDLTAAFVPVVLLAIWHVTISFLRTRYKRCPSDKILVVYGKVARASRPCVSMAAAPSSGR